MIDFLIYGKIIIDDILLADGAVVRSVLGGGGPQAAFGARLWHDSIGFLARSGTDMAAQHVQTLEMLDIDLHGWARFADIPTPYNQLISYDKDGYFATGDRSHMVMALDRAAWDQLLAQPLTLPNVYQAPQAIHLITEFAHEPMVEAAHALRKQGALLSLEPIMDFRQWTNRGEMLEFFRHVDMVTPDWPSASGLAGSDEPLTVMRYWARLGPRVIAIRHSEHGSYVWSADEDRVWHIPAVAVNVVDPTGAGNAYGGGLLAGWMGNRDVKTAGCYGAVSASFLVERVGLPTMNAALQRAAQERLQVALAAASKM
ncbi:MAG: carbohydrate kinase family protein [Caldilineaceae bacterium]|nr:carbohydrate kinase family protein [Caldilineaceae bacterium]